MLNIENINFETTVKIEGISDIVNKKITEKVNDLLFCKPIPVLYLAASPAPIATGRVPASMANVVMSMGRSLINPACVMASFLVMPCLTPSRAKSTIRIEFLVTSPSSIIIPIMLNISSILPVKKRAKIAPESAGGRASNMVNGVMNDS